MEDRQMEEQALFEQVWQRVCPQGSESLVVAHREPEQPVPACGMLPLTQCSPQEREFLCRQIGEEMKNSRRCLLLLNRYGLGMEMRDLSRCCEHRARRLSAALLLITGEWYLSPEKDEGQPWRDCKEGMRWLFHRFQAQSCLYAGKSAAAEDPLLRELYESLGMESLELRDRIRCMLER